MNGALFKKEMRSSLKLLVIFMAILTMYIVLIIGMYDQKTAQALQQFEKVMPEVMAAVGMQGTPDSLMHFMISYLYGFILLVFPMVYSIIRANGLVAKYLEQGSLVALLAAPVKRTQIVITQLIALISGVVLLLGYCTVLEIITIKQQFPNEFSWQQLLTLNAGLLALHLLLAGFCFLCSVSANDTKQCLTVSAGICALMYVLQMLANMGDKLANLRYFTVFTLFDANKLVANTPDYTGSLSLFLAAIVLFISSVWVFKKRELQV